MGDQFIPAGMTDGQGCEAVARGIWQRGTIQRLVGIPASLARDGRPRCRPGTSPRRTGALWWAEGVLAVRS
jgi:hypothetical protein